MKKRTIIQCLFLLFFTTIPLFLSSPAMAYDPKKDLVSAIDLKATGLMMKKTLSENGTATEGSSSREYSVPVGDGLSTYLDCSTPSRRDPTKETTKDFRTVFGFHILLK